MLDDLKKTAAGGSARERFRLSIVVALCLLAGGGIYAATMLGSKTNERRESLGADSETRDTTPPRPFVVDKAALAQEASGDEPFRWAAAALRRIDDAVKGKVDRIERVIRLDGNLDAAQQQKLLEIANKCPVHRTLHGEVTVPTRLDAGEDS